MARKILFTMLLSLILTGGLIVGNGVAQTDIPPLNVAVKLDKGVYLDTESIPITILLGNPGGDVITYDGFSNEDFHLMLVFTDPDGKGIIAEELKVVGPESGPPPIVWIDEEPIQAEPVETLPGEPDNWSFTVTLPDARAFYTLTRAGNYSVKAVIPLRTYSVIDYPDVDGVDYSRIESTGWMGVIESNMVNFSLAGDADGDSYSYPVAVSPYNVSTPDCDDQPDGKDGIPGTTDDGANINPGKSEVIGNGIDDDCNPNTLDVLAVSPGSIIVKADKHTVGNGNYPAASKEQIVGLPVRVYDKGADSCVREFGVSWQNYKSIWWSCDRDLQPNMIGKTDSNGTVSLTVQPGDYIVIGEYDMNPNTKGDEIYIGVSVGTIGSGETIQKYLQVIQKADGKNVPAKYTKRTGSELLIIEPEYIEWDGAQELYPLVFETIGDWTVTTSVSPPEGFVADQNSLTADVNTEIKAVQFTITDVGSDWVDTGVIHKIKHKGQSEVVRSKIGVKLSEKLAKTKGLSRFGNKIKGGK